MAKWFGLPHPLAGKPFMQQAYSSLSAAQILDQCRYPQNEQEDDEDPCDPHAPESSSAMHGSVHHYPACCCSVIMTLPR